MNKIRVIRGDITDQQVDVIVNAANRSLLGGGGVDGMIHYVAGPELREECKKIGKCETGEAKMTNGYRLPARYVIHVVGPVYGHEEDNEELLLSNCYTNSLKLARDHGLRTIAFPAISTGVFKYPKEEAAHIAIETVKYFISRNPDALDEIRFVLFDELNFNIYSQLQGNE